MMNRATIGLKETAIAKYQPSSLPLAIRKPLPKKQMTQISPRIPVIGPMTRRNPNSLDLSRKPKVAKTPSMYSSHVPIARVCGCILSNHLRESSCEKARENIFIVCQDAQAESVTIGTSATIICVANSFLHCGSYLLLLCKSA